MKESFPRDSLFITKDTRTTRWAVPYHYEALNSRVEHLLINNSDAINNKTVLDLGCHFGTFAYASILLGAAYVHGIDSEKKLIAEAHDLFAVHHVPRERYYFSCDEIVSFLEHQRSDSYDTVLCLGVFYYLNDPFHALQLMKKVARRYIILDTFSAYYGPCMSKEGERIFRSITDDTFSLPIVLYPQTQSKKRDYSIPSYFLGKRERRISMMTLPTITAFEYFFDLLSLKYRRILWDTYVVNNYTWKDFMSLEVKKASHWADIYHTGIRISYLLQE